MSLIELAESLNIVFFFSPAKVKEAVQPLDLACIGPFCEMYQKECHKLMIQTSSNISLSNLCSLICSVYEKAFFHSNIIEGFRKTGLFPLNKDALVVNDEESEITLKG